MKTFDSNFVFNDCFDLYVGASTGWANFQFLESTAIARQDIIRVFLNYKLIISLKTIFILYSIKFLNTSLTFAGLFMS